MKQLTFMGYEVATYEMLRLMQVAPTVRLIRAAHQIGIRHTTETAAIKLFVKLEEKPELESVPLLDFVVTTPTLTIRPVEVLCGVASSQTSSFLVGWGESVKQLDGGHWVSAAAQPNPFVRMRDAATQLGVPFFEMMLDYDGSVPYRRDEEVDILAPSDCRVTENGNRRISGAGAVAIYRANGELSRVFIRSYCGEISAVCWIIGLLQKAVKKLERSAVEMVQEARRRFEELPQEQQTAHLNELAAKRREQLNVAGLSATASQLVQ